MCWKLEIEPNFLLLPLDLEVLLLHWSCGGSWFCTAASSKLLGKRTFPPAQPLYSFFWLDIHMWLLLDQKRWQLELSMKYLLKSWSWLVGGSGSAWLNFSQRFCFSETIRNRFNTWGEWIVAIFSQRNGRVNRGIVIKRLQSIKNIPFHQRIVFREAHRCVLYASKLTHEKPFLISGFFFSIKRFWILVIKR